MTRDELIEHLDDALRELDEVETHVFGSLEQEVGNAIKSIRAAKGGARQLDSPPAMAWQDEPSEPGWHFVHQGGTKFRACRILAIPGKGWQCDGAGGLRTLNGRRVCPIPAPPPLTKRGGP